ncbi:MAG: IS21 family transposase [Candidatus Microthrix sp.]|jgi:transposase|nr:IS21 family transposase [Candidatus Microthrix sp.]MBK7021474.1 IS21 family transposase [Candidatus Microthrix sp.]MBP7407066.1 IS21 family transposase [Candidatus Microthrix sp.]
MAYREVAVFEVREVLRLWLALLAFRRIAEMVRCDRKTVTKIVRIAEGHGLVQTDSPDRLTDDFVGGVMAELAPKVPDRHGEAWNVLVGHREKLEGWRNDDVPAKKMVELLKRDGVVVPERTLNRYLAAEFGSPERSTVPVVDGEPGVELQVDFGELGRMFDEETGKKRRVWALVFTAGVSRHTFVWLSFNQNLATVIDGCEAAWQFFGGVFRVLVPDNMATVVTKADALDPVLNVAFVEYAQSRGFLIDPARVRSPQDKGRVERAVQFVQTSFWAGEDFGCLAEAQTAAELWCRSRAGLRTHGTTQAQPAVTFAEVEAPVLLPAPTERYDVPLYKTAKVHRDHHIQVAKSLYSVPGDLIGTSVDVRADKALVKIFSGGQLVKVHPRQKAGARITDPADLPSELTGYAMRNIDDQIRRAYAHGQHVGVFAEVILDGPLPWTRMRHVYKLLRTCDRYGPDRVNTACERAVDAGATSVVTVVGMVERALEADQATAEPAPPDNVIIGRFARDASHFAAGRKVTR